MPIGLSGSILGSLVLSVTASPSQPYQILGTLPPHLVPVQFCKLLILLRSTVTRQHIQTMFAPLIALFD